jgi:hypothetical protein
VACSDPLTLPFPRGVRMASKMSGSVAAMGQLLEGVSGVVALDTVFGNPACNVTHGARAAS